MLVRVYCLIFQLLLVLGHLPAGKPPPASKYATRRMIESKIVSISDACDLAHETPLSQKSSSDTRCLRNPSQVRLVEFVESKGSCGQDHGRYDRLGFSEGSECRGGRGIMKTPLG